jgi:hypothetical protein
MTVLDKDNHVEQLFIEVQLLPVFFGKSCSRVCKWVVSCVVPSFNIGVVQLPCNYSAEFLTNFRPIPQNFEFSVDLIIDWTIVIFDNRKNSPGEVVITSENGERRVLRSTPDWSEDALNTDHLWVTTSASGDLCYVGDSECTVSRPLYFKIY